MSRYYFRPQIIYHPPAELLPPGFKFPKAYLDFIHQEEVVALYPWFPMCFAERREYYDHWVASLKREFPERQFVPFAKDEEGDVVACFELSDNPECPDIHHILAFTTPEWTVLDEGPGGDFDAWLEVIKKYSFKYQEEHPDVLYGFIYDLIERPE